MIEHRNIRELLAHHLGRRFVPWEAVGGRESADVYSTARANIYTDGLFRSFTTIELQLVKHGWELTNRGAWASEYAMQYRGMLARIRIEHAPRGGGFHVVTPIDPQED